MGFDVTYHPVSEQMLHICYFDLVLAHAEVVDRCAEKGIDKIFCDKLQGWVEHDRALLAGSNFDTTIGYHAAAAAGIFTRYHYLRGGLLSAVEGIDPYTKSWQEIVPSLAGHHSVQDRIVENYSSGVYIPSDAVPQLRHDLVTSPTMMEATAKIFPPESLAILLSVLDEAIEKQSGLLEATDVIEPNPLDLNATTGASNRLNCDLAGPLLYQQVAMEQLGQSGLADAVAAGNVERVVVHSSGSAQAPVKRSFLDRLRGS